MTLISPNAQDTTLFQDGQAAGSISAGDVREEVDSLAGLASSTQTASYTLVLTDRGTRIRMNSATSVNVTFPPHSSVAFDVDTVIVFCQVGLGQITFVQGAGVTLLTPASLTSRIQYATISFQQDSQDVWIASGDLT